MGRIQHDRHPGDALYDKFYALFSPLRRKLTRRESIALVFFCTLIGAGAQVLMKMGAHALPAVGVTALLANPFLILRNFYLMGGLSLYGMFTVLLVFALRDGELSIIYPIIALNYVWVTCLSLVFFHETLNPFKAGGILVIMLGVVVLGRSGQQ
jgi:drug/metabolite transporter (DMT)-like permease